MKNVHELLTKIADITREIETNYPEVYNYLNEDPMTIPNMEHPSVDETELREYLASLEMLLEKYKKDH
ncbi:hypothetical protein [Mangrovimonas sp. DI 80]|uniref:hypothetical protein n=1 Tax=Mangrovimonas sp. DI 80 TaxID=1779330 RepID=UPI0009776A5F|nr:hypothetical protein [Mangrovimonas sp. DI 80]OMP32237.1 hypothetical protein BKM32_04075 [Mangrovimonas sp. DI 80]